MIFAQDEDLWGKKKLKKQWQLGRFDKVINLKNASVILVELLSLGMRLK